ncbi:MAG: gfo/Idh/MocA family oxidoreductase [Puniceicoccaceae bacterium]|nr:MAG: gfo/Idh/MocA family oxidoreductase [Puniceicoccaceae bacterium]
MARLAFLSTAHIHTRGFIENVLKAGDGRTIAGIWDDAADRGRRYAEKADAHFEPDLDRLLHNPEVDGFVICAENTRHLDLLRRALPIGKPVFCEKPLVTTVDDLAELRRLLAVHPTPLCSGYFQPFSPALRSAAGLIAADAFGAITRIRYRNAHHAAYGRWFDSPDLAWFTDPALSGGGGFMDMGTHALHLVRTLFGPATEAWAEIANHSGQYPACDDYGIAHLRFANGILGTIEAGWTQTGGLQGLEITGAKACLWNTPDGYVLGAPGEPPAPLAITAQARPSTIDRLVAIIRGSLTEEEWRADLEAALDTVALMAACYQSAETKNWTGVARP